MQKDVCFWLSGLTKTQCDEFCKSHTPRHSQEKHPTPNADEKKIFFLARTKNGFLTKERLSDYAIKRIRLWPKIFISSTTVLKCYRKSTMISSIQAFKIMYHPCTAIWGESSRRSARSSCFLYKRGQYYAAVS